MEDASEYLPYCRDPNPSITEEADSVSDNFVRCLLETFAICCGYALLGITDVWLILYLELL